MKKDQNLTRFQTFRPCGKVDAAMFERTLPYLANGRVNHQVWQVTFELIDEPYPVLRERVQKLWNENVNELYRGPLKRAAEELGFELQGEMGAKGVEGKP